MNEIGDLITAADAAITTANNQAALDLAIAAEAFEATAEAKRDEAASTSSNAGIKAD